MLKANDAKMSVPTKADSSVENQKSKCINFLRPQIEQFPAKTDVDMQILSAVQSRLNTAPLLNFQKCPLHISSSEPNRIGHIFCDHHNQCLHRDKCVYLSDCRKELRKTHNLKVYEGRICCEELLTQDTRVPIIASRLAGQREKCGLSLRNVSDRCWISHVALYKHEKKTSSGVNTIEKSLCYYLAALYGTTPGYLMGQTDDDTTDIYVTRYTFKEENKSKRTCHQSVPIVIISVSELSLPILFFSAERRAGMDAKQEIEGLINDPEKTEYHWLKETGLLSFLKYGKSIYCEMFPEEIRKLLAQFVNAIPVRDPFESKFDGYEMKCSLGQTNGQTDEVNTENP